MSLLRDILEGVTVSLKSNYLPEITIPVTSDGSDRGGLADLLGVRGGLVIRNRNGGVIETIGQPTDVNPLRFALVVIIVGGGAVALIRGIVK